VVLYDDVTNPRWRISILGHNFGVDQHFRTKFGTEMQNRQSKGTQCSEIRFLKIQDGGHHVKSQKSYFNSVDELYTGWRKKNGASLSHCKYYENFITELRGNW